MRDMYAITDKQADALRRAVRKRGDAEAALDAVAALRADPPWKQPKLRTFAEAGARTGAMRTPAQIEARRRNMAKARAAAHDATRRYRDMGAKPTTPGWYVRTAEGAHFGPFVYRSYAERRARRFEGSELVKID